MTASNHLPRVRRTDGLLTASGSANDPTGTQADGPLIRRVVWVLGLHVPLGLLMYGVPAVATAHAALTLMVAVFLALSGRLHRVVYVAAYIAGSEVLWRMSRAAVLWETGKYGVILIFTIALLRVRPFRLSALPMLYFVLLLPSIVLAPYDLLSDQARQQISFDLSGPAALAVSVCFLSQVRLSRDQWLRTVIALTGPLVAIVTIAVYNTIAASSLSFSLNSNMTTSGGYGPNQVSAAIGLGAALTSLQGMDPRRRLFFRWTMLSIALVFAAQSAMTFSRGGLYSAGAAVIAAAWYLQRERRTRSALLLAATALSLMAVFVILPRLDRFTGGKVVARFEITDVTGRDRIAREELRAFWSHPVGGLGPGGVSVTDGRHHIAHTEFTRLLGQHGMLGVSALLVLLAMALRALAAARTVQEKALVAALLAWSFVTMAHMAMRIVAPSLVFGLAFALSSHGLARPARLVRAQ